jgi:hypothetical protein
VDFGATALKFNPSWLACARGKCWRRREVLSAGKRFIDAIRAHAQDDEAKPDDEAISEVRRPEEFP